MYHNTLQSHLRQPHQQRLRRRQMLAALGIGSAGFFLDQALLPTAANAQEGQPDPLFVFGYFAGGWDTLLGLDPRNEQIFGTAGKAIHTAYAQLAQQDADLAAILAQNPTGLIQPAGSNIVFGPTMSNLAAHYEDLCVVRGMSMGTLTHEVGRRYFLTGKFPRGLAANGSALPTWIAHNGALDTQLPNLVFGNETYNEGLAPTASGVVVRSSKDLFYLMNRLETPLDTATDAAIANYLAAAGCSDTKLDGTGLVSSYHASRPAAELLASGELWKHFAYNEYGKDPEITALLDHFGASSAPPAALFAIEQAATAAQALKYGISQTVSISLAQGIDHHNDTFQTDHAPALRHGFDAIAQLISFLKDPANGSGGKPLWDRTVLVLWSEFARTPKLNARDGRDHHLTSACLVAGKGVVGNRVIGASSDDNYQAQPIDLSSGEVDSGGHVVVPADVHATILSAMGLSYDHISNQSPKVIDAMLTG